MPLPVPNLDNRRFQDLVDEAKRQIPRFCPTWTDHNVSDPGITLIELFAWMTEQFLFRLNQVPDRNFLTFLNLIGANLAPAQPARGDVTFRLSSAATSQHRAIIPAWTEIATERTDTQEAIVFSTDYEAEVIPSTPRWLLTSLTGDEYEDHSEALQHGAVFNVWGTPPRTPHALYIGFEEDLGAHTLVLQFTIDPRAGIEKQGIGINPDKPPWRWQAWRSNQFGWEDIRVRPRQNDTTLGLNRSGEVTLYLPYRCQPHRLQAREARTWIRCLPVDDPSPGESAYQESPRIGQVGAFSIGITVPVTHALPVGPEVLGTSNGQPGQTFRVLHQNVLKLAGPEEVVEVQVADNWEPWQLVSDFGDSKPPDKHYTFDPITGEVGFGPVIRQTNGTEPQFGAVPPLGHAIRMQRYRIGGGVRGSVAAEQVKVLKSTLPYVASVVNRQAIVGGLEVQSLEDAKLRAPSLLRTRFRAVTAQDFEFLSLQVEGVGRVRCLQPLPDDPGSPAPGTVLLLVIPSLPPLEGAELERHVGVHEILPQESSRAAVEQKLQEELLLPSAIEMHLRDHLDGCRLLTTRLEIHTPQYIWVAVEIRVKTQPNAEPERVRRDVKAALYRFLHPRFGGPDGAGWPFGQKLTIDKVYALIQTVPGVAYATELKLYPIDLTNALGQRLGQSSPVIEVPPNGVIVSYYHNVYLERSQ